LFADIRFRVGVSASACLVDGDLARARAHLRVIAAVIYGGESARDLRDERELTAG